MKRLAIVTIASFLACSQPVNPVLEEKERNPCACPPPPPPVGLVYGTVRDSADNGLAGAVVSFSPVWLTPLNSGPRDTTDSAGGYRLMVYASQIRIGLHILDSVHWYPDTLQVPMVPVTQPLRDSVRFDIRSVARP